MPEPDAVQPDAVRSGHPSTPATRPYAVAAVVASLALVLAGCSGMSSAGATRPTGTGEGAPSVSAATTSVATGASASSGGAASITRGTGGHTASSSATDETPVLAAGSGTLRIVALGDSVPSGAGCACDPFPELSGPLLAERTGRQAAVDNLAAGGQTSADVLDELRDPDVIARLRRADVVIVEIGANDFDEDLADSPDCADPLTAACDGPALAETKDVLDRITGAIAAQQRSADARIVLMGYWNVFRDGQVGASRGATYVAASAKLTDAFNGVVEDVAKAGGAIYADTVTPFKGDGTRDATFALAPDGNHPNEVGHRLLAQAVVDSLDRAGALAR